MGNELQHSAEVVLVEDGEPKAHQAELCGLSREGAVLKLEIALTPGQRIVLNLRGVGDELFSVLSFDEPTSSMPVNLRVGAEVLDASTCDVEGAVCEASVRFLGSFHISNPPRGLNREPLSDDTRRKQRGD